VNLYARSWRHQPSPSAGRASSPDHMPSDQNMEGDMKNASDRRCGLHHKHQTAARRRRRKTYTENVSLHGARVYSQRPWQPGEEAQVTPLKYGTPCGKSGLLQAARDGSLFRRIKLPPPSRLLVQLYLPRGLVTVGIISAACSKFAQSLPVAPCIIVSGQTPAVRDSHIDVP